MSAGEFDELGLDAQADFRTGPTAADEVFAWEEGVWREFLDWRGFLDRRWRSVTATESPLLASAGSHDEFFDDAAAIVQGWFDGLEIGSGYWVGLLLVL